MHDIDCLRRSSMLYLDRYRKLQMYNPQQVEEVEVEEEAEVVEEEEAEVVEDYLGRTERKELSIHRQGSNSIVLAEEAEEGADIQGMDY